MTSHSNLSILEQNKKFKVVTVSLANLKGLSLEQILNEAEIPATYNLVTTVELKNPDTLLFIFGSDLKETLGDLQSLLEVSADIFEKQGQSNE